MISFVHALTRGTDTLKENTPLDLSVFPNPVKGCIEIENCICINAYRR